ncbi:MAG: hypothetical protein OXU86_06250 [Thaumarchaeota archaeon]|nr:hypothetical protein [Nitrososphaerota archaeon]
MAPRLTALALAVILLVPAHALAQAPDRIIVDHDLGERGRGDYLMVHGTLASPGTGQFVIVQVSNPRGDLCSIQQLRPLTGGAFVTAPVPLRGPLCGVEGEYDVRMFYGEHSQSSSFTLSGAGTPAPEGDALLAAAQRAFEARIARTQGIDTAPFTALAANLATANAIETVYANLLEASFSDSTLDGLDVTLRRAVAEALDAIASLEGDSVIDAGAATRIRELVYASILRHEAGDLKTSAERINAAYAAILEASPSSVSAPQRPPTFEELEATLLSLMQRSGSILSKQVRSELAVALSRGTAPVLADDLRSMLDILTHARYLDIVERKEDRLHSLVGSEWRAIRPQVTSASSVEATVSLANRTAPLYDAALLLRDLDKVEDFVGADGAGELAVILRPEWESLRSALSSASSVGAIMERAADIRGMKAAFEVSSRLEQVIRITRANGLETDVTRQWPGLLERARAADSLGALLEVVSQFEESISSLREARNPLAALELEYRSLRAKAEQQSDRAALAGITNALSILDLAQRLSSGNPPPARLDRVEVLLAWVSQEAGVIAQRLDSYDEGDVRLRAERILERANSLENLAELGRRTKRFVPGYSDYVDEVKEKVSRARALVISGELRLADDLVRNAISEWNEVDAAYRDNPPSGEDYGLVDIRKREYTKHVDALQAVADRFLVAGTDEARELGRMLDRASEFTEHGNFVDAQEWVTRAYEYAQDHLNEEHNSVIFNLDRDVRGQGWTINGFVEKQAFDRREDIAVTVLHANSTVHSKLEFSDTRHGAFSIPWSGPSEPGIYVAELLYRDALSANIVYIPYDPGTREEQERRNELSGGPGLIAASRDLFDLREFMRGFGGERYQANIGRIDPVVADAQEAVDDRDEDEARSKVTELRTLIERYLPQRSPEAAIRVEYSQGSLLIEGAVKKSIAFPEDLYVDIFDQSGVLVTTVALTDDREGAFSQTLVRTFEQGTHVALLSFHDLRVSDFFSVGR